jgi:hypothetical protein
MELLEVSCCKAVLAGHKKLSVVAITIICDTLCARVFGSQASHRHGGGGALLLHGSNVVHNDRATYQGNTAELMGE